MHAALSVALVGSAAVTSVSTPEVMRSVQTTVNAETAATLVVHPNTVAYRLARIEALTGRSLRRADTRMELHLALTVHDVADPGAVRD